MLQVIADKLQMTAIGLMQLLHLLYVLLLHNLHLLVYLLGMLVELLIKLLIYLMLSVRLNCLLPLNILNVLSHLSSLPVELLLDRRL